MVGRVKGGRSPAKRTLDAANHVHTLWLVSQRSVATAQQAAAFVQFIGQLAVATPAQMLTPLLVRALQGQAVFAVVLSSPATAPGAWRFAARQLASAVAAFSAEQMTAAVP